SRLIVTGNPVAVVEGVRRGAGGVGAGTEQFSISDTGTLAYLPGPVTALGGGQVFMAFFDQSGNIEPLKLPAGAYSTPRLSPDGIRVAFGRSDGRDSNIWILDLSTEASPRRLTFGGHDRFPVW